jgi:hypothetical protein
MTVWDTKMQRLGARALTKKTSPLRTSRPGTRGGRVGRSYLTTVTFRFIDPTLPLVSKAITETW